MTLIKSFVILFILLLVLFFCYYFINCCSIKKTLFNDADRIQTKTKEELQTELFDKLRKALIVYCENDSSFSNSADSVRNSTVVIEDECNIYLRPFSINLKEMVFETTKFYPTGICTYHGKFIETKDGLRAEFTFRDEAWWHE